MSTEPSPDTGVSPWQRLLGPLRRSYLAKFVLTLCLIIVFIGIIGFFFQVDMTSTLEDDVQAQVTEETQANANQLKEWKRANERPALAISDHPRLENESAYQTHVNESLSTQFGDEEDATIHIVDAIGDIEIIASTDTERVNNTVDYPWTQLFSELRTDRVSMSEPYRTSDDEVVISFLTLSPQNLETVVVIELNADLVTDQLSSGIDGTLTEIVQLKPDGGQVLFSDQEGAAVLEPYVEEKSPGEITELREATANATVINEPTRGKQHDGDYLAASATVDGTDWIVVKNIPESDAYALSSNIRQAFLIFLGLAVLGVVLVGGTLGRNTTNALRSVTKQAKQVEQGQYETELETTRQDEIGDLVDALEGMRLSLKSQLQEVQQSRDTVRQHNEQLQVLDRVLRHNLKNKTNAIMLNAEIIDRNGDQQLRQRADHIVDTCEDLLAKAEKQRIITQALAPDTSDATLDIVPKIEYTVAALSETHPEASIESILPEKALVVGNPYIRLAVGELIENPIVHNDNEPIIEVSVTKESDTVRIQITDNAPHIPDPDRQVLTGEANLNPLKHGSGIGTWVVYRVVTESGGTVQCKQLEPRGNRITVFLPAADTTYSGRRKL